MRCLLVPKLILFVYLSVVAIFSTMSAGISTREVIAGKYVITDKVFLVTVLGQGKHVIHTVVGARAHTSVR